ncbi:MAG: hypothetical protein L6Q54_10315 [Leptospiraceae bacterium]|nr:hypothetical protein [Leptospiraceae bacterium]MCK6381621.1 hypothetical protein [Leptospiraceae bacterium]NUM40820.1 hypothetical protein [Leptospiraceae bacterium]
MEKEIKDALNFTIGAIATVKSEAEKLITKIESEFKTLATKGAQDNGELSVNLRKYAEEGVKGFQNLIGDLNKKVDEVKTKVTSK